MAHLPVYVNYNGAIIYKFYSSLRYKRFSTLTKEKVEELDSLVAKHRYYFASRTNGYGSLMTLTAEQLVTSPQRYGLTNGDEIIYFYIRMVDPDLLFLEAYESANTKDEMKTYFFKNFHIYDKNLVILESKLNEALNLIPDNSIWSRGRINKDFK